MQQKLYYLFSLSFSIFFVWTVYRYFLLFPEWIDELIFKPLIFLFPILIAVHFFEKKTLKSLGVSTNHILRYSFLGLLIGLLLSFETLCIKFIKYGSLTTTANTVTFHPAIIIFLLSVITAVCEETVYRGYFLTRFSKALRSPMYGNLISSLFFALIHLPLFIFINHYSLSTIFVSILLLCVLGFINGMLFLYTKTLTAPIVSHTIWNSISYFF